jgi:hypothetical protein
MEPPRRTSEQTLLASHCHTKRSSISLHNATYKIFRVCCVTVGLCSTFSEKSRSAGVQTHGLRAPHTSDFPVWRQWMKINEPYQLTRKTRNICALFTGFHSRPTHSIFITLPNLHGTWQLHVQSPSWEAIHGTQMFITVLTKALHWYLSWRRWIQSTYSHHISLTSILILYSYLIRGFPSGLFPSGSSTNILYKLQATAITSPSIWSILLSKKYK